MIAFQVAVGIIIAFAFIKNWDFCVKFLKKSLKAIIILTLLIILAVSIFIFADWSWSIWKDFYLKHSSTSHNYLTPIVIVLSWYFASVVKGSPLGKIIGDHVENCSNKFIESKVPNILYLLTIFVVVGSILVILLDGFILHSVNGELSVWGIISIIVFFPFIFILKGIRKKKTIVSQ